MPSTMGILELVIATLLDDLLDDWLNTISLNCSNSAFDISFLGELELFVRAADYMPIENDFKKRVRTKVEKNIQIDSFLQIK